MEEKNLYSWAWWHDQDGRLKKLIFDIVLCIVTSSVLITGKIFKSQMHSKLYNLPQSYFLLSTTSRGSNGYARINVRFPDKNDKLVQTL